MSKKHFLPFQINTIIFIFAFVLQTGCRLLSAILDVRNSLSIELMAISDKYEIFDFFTKWPAAPILDVRN